MRISVEKDDPGYRAYKALPKNVRTDVYLNGEILRDVLTADSKRGFVVVVDRSTGDLRVTKRHTVALLRRHGSVEIVIRQKP